MDQGDLFLPSPGIPYQGRTAKSAHASFTGAQAQSPVWGQKTSELLQCLRAGGPMSRQELAAVLRWPISSVCSVLDNVRDLIEPVDFETVAWSGGRTTKRERFRVKRR